jgi:uncharacterized protein with von Willebrand factor type A (vWA) domain
VSDLRDDLAVFVHLLRAAGLSVPTPKAVTFAEAAHVLSPVTTEDLYWAGRTTLLSRQEHLATYERLFGAWFLGRPDPAAPPGDGDGDGDGDEAQRRPIATRGDIPAGRSDDGLPLSSPAEPDGDAGHQASGDDGIAQADEIAGAIASAIDAVRNRRFDQASEQELQAIRELMATLVVIVPPRRSRRMRPARRGPRPDLRRAVRGALQTDGELLRQPMRRRRMRPRRLVLLLDVSGSMAGFSRALLQFAFTARLDTRTVEVFCFGTRLTRLTEDLDGRNIDAALSAASERVTDWDGGTLIGPCLATLTRTYGRQGLLSGAVVVICSDGLDRGEPEQVAQEMARIARYAHRIIWVNPLKADPRYEPLARGMAAALPYVDRLLTGHDLASLQALAGVLRELPRT